MVNNYFNRIDKVDIQMIQELYTLHSITGNWTADASSTVDMTDRSFTFNLPISIRFFSRFYGLMRRPYTGRFVMSNFQTQYHATYNRTQKL